MTEFAGFQDGFALVNELASEVAAIVRLRGQLPAQQWARIVLRSVFALLEGFISRFKGRALEMQKYRELGLSPKLLRILYEGEDVTRDDGSVEWEKIKPRTSDNLKGSLRAYATALKTDTPLGGDVSLPPEFSLALAARNRITHPKKLADLIITDEEFRSTGEILKWTMAISTWSKDQELRDIEDIRHQVNENFEKAKAQLAEQLKNSKQS
jgi:hypothetical protein